MIFLHRFRFSFSPSFVISVFLLFFLFHLSCFSRPLLSCRLSQSPVRFFPFFVFLLFLLLLFDHHGLAFNSILLYYLLHSPRYMTFSFLSSPPVRSFVFLSLPFPLVSLSFLSFLLLLCLHLLHFISHASRSIFPVSFLSLVPSFNSCLLPSPPPPPCESSLKGQIGKGGREDGARVGEAEGRRLDAGFSDGGL